MLDKITPVVLTYNEAPNIARTLKRLAWANQVIVLDSLSTDNTKEICRGFSNVCFLERAFDTHAQQWNTAISHVDDGGWVLALDADYCLSDELIAELKSLSDLDSVVAFEICFIYKINGHQLRGSLYPPVTALYKKSHAHYVQDGHTQRVVIDGSVGKLNNKIFHDDRKSPARWHHSQRNYASQEALKFKNTKFTDFRLIDKLRFFGLGPLLVVPYTLFIKGVCLNGLPGLKYTYQRFIAEVYLLNARFK